MKEKVSSKLVYSSDPRALRRALFAGAAAATVSAIASMTASPAIAHHGWGGFDTSRAYNVTPTQAPQEVGSRPRLSRLDGLLGLKRPLKVGEKIEAVGLLNDGGNGDYLRPVIFWLADGRCVWQQLTAFPQPPEPLVR